MATKPIDFSNKLASGDESLSGASPIAMNVVIDGKGTVRRRPAIVDYDQGYGTYSFGGGGVSAVHVTYDGKMYVVDSNTPSRGIFYVTPTGNVDLSNAVNGDLRGTLRPFITETEALLVISGGQQIQKVVLDTVQSSRLGGDPPRGSHCIFNASRLLSNDLFIDRSAVRFSEPANDSNYAGHESWAYGGVGTSGFFYSDAQADPIVALGENSNEVFSFGSSTLQLYRRDEKWDFTALDTLELGCSAPYSVIKVGNNFAWLSHRREFVISDGRSFEVISDDIQQTLDDIEVFDDCYGFHVHEGPLDCLVWKFPTDGRTFSYQRGGGWSTWMGWNEVDNNWQPWSLNCHHRRVDDSTNVVGTTNGKIGKLQMGESDDLDSRVVAFVESGFIDRGNDRRKHCKTVNFAFKRGTVTGTKAPVALFRWADAPGKWEAPIEIDLGRSAETEPVVTFRSLGIYRRRDWRLEFSSTEDLVLSRATEEYETLEV